MTPEITLGTKTAIALGVLSVALIVVNIFQRPGQTGIFSVARETVNAEAASNVNEGRVLGEATPNEACTEQPTKSFGSCSYFLGAYFDGSTCRAVYGCTLEGESLPFTDIGACHMQCASSQ